jgi:hypothetical protein
MTWVVSKLSIQGVKGVLDRSGDFELLKGKRYRSIVIFAPNGCGKSGYADAVEYFFSEDGGIDHLGKGGADSEKGGKHAIPHILAEEKGIDPKITITLANLDTSKKLEIERAVLTGRTDPRPVELNEIITLAPAHRVLRQHDLRRFVVDYSPSDKYSELSRWIGLTKLETILKHLGTTSRALESTNVQREIDERVQDIKNVTNDLIIEYDSQKIFLWCSNQASQYLPKRISIEKWSDVSTTLPKKLNEVKENLLLSSGAAEAFKAKQALDTNLPSFTGKDGALYFCDVPMQTMVDAFDRVQNIRADVKENIFAEVWATANDILEKQPIDQCPVCLTDWEHTGVGSQNAARVYIQQSLNQLSALKAAEKELDTSIIGAKKQVSKFIAEWTEIKNNILPLELVEYQQQLKEVDDTIEKIEPFSSQPLEIQKKYRLCQSKIKKFLETLQSKLKTFQIKGAPKEVKEIDDLITNLKTLSDASNRLTDLEREQNEYRKIETNFNQIKDEIRIQVADLVNGIVATFREDVIDIYEKIHPSNAVPNIYIEPDVEGQSLKLRIDFHQAGRTVPPAGYLSESYINTLGLALFISSVRLFNRQFPFIFLDDIVSSYDADHRARIVDVIAESLDDFQVVLTTHDHMFYTMLRDRLADKDWLFERIASWDIEHGPHRESDAISGAEIEQLIQAGNTGTAGNAVRQNIEEWLDKICERYQVRTVHRRGYKDYKRTLYDFWGPFLDRIQSFKDDYFVKNIASQPSYDRLKSSPLLNYYSHAQSHPYEWPALGDVQYVWTEFKDFQNLFHCFSCKKLLEYSQDRNRLYCTCGRQIFPDPK